MYIVYALARLFSLFEMSHFLQITKYYVWNHSEFQTYMIGNFVF